MTRYPLPTRVVPNAASAAYPYPYDDAAYEALYEHEPSRRLSGYGGVSVRASTLNQNPSLWIGGRGGVIVAGRISLGAAFYEVTMRRGGPILDPAGRELGLRAAYGGAQVGFGLVDRRRLHVALDTLVGGGAACISSRSGYEDGDWRCIEGVNIFVTETGVSARFDVAQWFRVGMTAGYRFVGRKAWRPPNEFQLSGPYLGLDLDFGWFSER